MKCFFDIETTSKDAANAEIITGYFYFDTTAPYDYEFKSQIDNWSNEAAEIHGISHSEMLFYPPKHYALECLNDVLINLPKDTEFICFANPQNMDGFYHYDKAVIEMQFNLYDLPFRFQHVTSVHTIAKELAKNRAFEPLRNKDTNRYSFTQENVYMALFGSKYDAHKAKDDVLAMIRIYNELIDRKINGKVVNRQQLELF